MGRVIVKRLALSIEVVVLEFSREMNVHAIYVRLKNEGTVAIADPEVELTVRDVLEGSLGGEPMPKTNEIVSLFRRDEGQPPFQIPLRNEINSDLDKSSIYRDWSLERGEEETLHALWRVQKAIPIVTYTVRVRVGQKRYWTTMRSVSNRATPART